MNENSGISLYVCLILPGCGWQSPPDVQRVGPAVLLLPETRGHGPHRPARLSPLRHQHRSGRSHHWETWKLLRRTSFNQVLSNPD